MEEVTEVVAEEATEEVEQSSILDMSDEEMANMPMPTDDGLVEQEEITSEEESEEETEVEEQTPETTTFAEEGTEETSTKEVEAELANSEDKDSEVDYKAEYLKLMAPFKANNKEMSIESVEDALSLMKMGANYNKKMAGLKPNLKILKMLENNKLLDEEKLSYLIDLDKKNPEAITKLIKDSGIDPLDVNVEKATEYNPSTYTVDDREVELDSVLDEIRDTQAYSTTIDIVSNKWDQPSKQVLLENPGVIKLINDQVGSGIYDQINKVVEQERMYGRLSGVSDLMAYKQVGDAMQAKGAFNDAPANTIKPSAKAKPVQDPKLKDRKKAASPTKSSPSKSGPTDFNPLSMSDDEFDKIAMSKYM